MPRRSIRSSTTKSTRSSIATYRRPSRASTVTIKMRKHRNYRTLQGGSYGIRSLPMYNAIFPPHKLYKLPYMQSFALIPHASLYNTVGAVQNFCLNGVYDPDITGVGHQPLYRDTLLGDNGTNASYGRYKVIGVDVNIKWYDPKADGSRCIWRLLNPTQVYNSDTMANSDADYACEKLNTNSLILNNTGSQVRTTKFFLPLYKASGLTKLQFNADPDNFTADYGSNPGSKIYLQLGTSNDRALGTAGDVVAQVRLVYHVVMYGRNTPVTS